MKKKINFNHILLSIVYILFELFIYYLFISNAFFNKYNLNINNIKLFGIIGVFAFSLLFFIFYLFKYKNQDKKDEIRDELLVLNGLFFTLISSIFIIIFETQYILIASTSIISELSYFLRLLKNDEIPKKRLKYSIFIRILLIALASLILSTILKDFEILYLIMAFNYINLLFNFIDTLLSLINNKNLTKKENKISLILFSVGLFLFIIYDSFIYINYFTNSISNIAWIFYLPSEIIISFSSFNLLNLGLAKEYE